MTRFSPLSLIDKVHFTYMDGAAKLCSKVQSYTSLSRRETMISTWVLAGGLALGSATEAYMNGDNSLAGVRAGGGLVYMTFPHLFKQQPMEGSAAMQLPYDSDLLPKSVLYLRGAAALIATESAAQTLAIGGAMLLDIPYGDEGMGDLLSYTGWCMMSIGHYIFWSKPQDPNKKEKRESKVASLMKKLNPVYARNTV